MPYHDDIPSHPRAEDIRLTSANEAVRNELAESVSALLTSEIAVTYEVTDTQERSGMFKLPNPRYLARAVIMKLSGMPDSLDSEQDSEPETSVPLYQVAVVAEAHQLDAEKAREISQEESNELGFVWPDGVKLHFLDNSLNNISTWYTCWQNALNSFDFTGNGYGFTREAVPSATNAVLEAAGVSVPDSLLDGPGITPGGLKYFAEIRAIHEVLTHGQADIASTKRLVGILATRETTENLTTDVEVIRSSSPHFRNLVTQGFSSPSFRNMLAWQQYCEQTWAR